jgi:hypothetical protein
LEADVLLHPDDLPDAFVLDSPFVGRRNPARRKVIARLKDLLGAEEAADVVSPEWGNSSHDCACRNTA